MQTITPCIIPTEEFRFLLHIKCFNLLFNRKFYMFGNFSARRARVLGVRLLKFNKYLYLFIYFSQGLIHHHHHVTLSARIFLTFSRHTSLLSIASGRSCRFELNVLSLIVYVKGSIRVHHLWARPYFSSSVPHVWFV